MALVEYLPPKYEYVIKIRMSDLQIKLYKAYLNKISITKENIFRDQMNLARIWTHPQLIQDTPIGNNPWWSGIIKVTNLLLLLPG